MEEGCEEEPGGDAETCGEEGRAEAVDDGRAEESGGHLVSSIVGYFCREEGVVDERRDRAAVHVES